MTKLKEVMLAAQTANQLNAIIVDYTHEEIMEVYYQLTLEQQFRIQRIWESNLKIEQPTLICR